MVEFYYQSQILLTKFLRAFISVIQIKAKILETRWKSKIAKIELFL